MSFFGKKKKSTGVEAASPPAAAGPMTGGGSGSNYARQSTAPVRPEPPANGLPPALMNGGPLAMNNGPPPSHPAPAAPPPTANQAPPPAQSSSSTVVYPWSKRDLFRLPVLHASDPNGDTSYGAPSPAPFPRYGHSANSMAASAGGDVYIFGGLVDGQQKLSNSLYVLQCMPNRGGEGQTGAPHGTLNIGLVETRGEIPGPRFGHASVGVGNVLIVWGGDTKASEDDESRDNALYLLNLSTREWTRVEVTGLAPECRYGHAAAMVGSRFYIFGGQHADSRFLGDLWNFDLQKLKAGMASWTPVELPPGAITPPKRTGHTCVTFGDSLFIFGGTDGQYHYNDTWQYDTNTKTWTELLCIGYIPVPREGHSATLVDDVMYVFGGRGVDGKDLEDLAAFKISNQRWYMFQNMGPSPSGRSGHAMATFQNKVYVLGGESFPPAPDTDHATIHVLDTGKIKYPQDKNAAARKSQAADANGAKEEAARQRAASPTGRALGNSPASLTQIANEAAGQPASSTGRNTPSSIMNPSAVLAQQQAAKAKAAGVPQRPRREGDERAASPLGSQAPLKSLAGAMDGDDRSAALATRSMSPNNVPPPRPKAAPPLTTSPQISPPAHYTPTFANQTGPAPAGALSASMRSQVVRSPSPTSSRGANDSPRNMQSGRFGGASVDGRVASPTQMSNTPLISQITDGKASKREAWLRSALALAVARGFLLSEAPPNTGDDADFERDTSAATRAIESLASGATTEGSKHTVEALVSLKQELNKLKRAIAQQATTADSQIAAANQGRGIALQDAARSRAKLAALEANAPADFARVERERASDLERQLAETSRSRGEIEQRISQLSAELAHERTARAAAESRATAANQRAEATESSYSRSLTDYAELQRRAHSHETAQHSHLEQIASLTAAVTRAQADHSHAKSRLETSETSLDQYLRTLEQTQSTLTAANSQADEMQALWVQAKEDAVAAEARANELQSALDSKEREASAATLRADELERVLRTTRSEHDAMRALTTGGLADLVAASKDGKSRALETADLHAQQVSAAEEEAQSLRELAKESRLRANDAIAELADSRERQSQFEKQVLVLRSEVATLRSQHAAALDDVALHKGAASNRESELRERIRAHEASEAKAAVMHSVLNEHGLAEDASLDLSSSSLSNLSPDQLVRRVQELEARLDARSKSHRALEAAHDSTRRDLQSAEQQVRDGVRERAARANQMDQLQGELERSRSPAGGSGDFGSGANTRALRAENDLQDLQEKHRSLEASHVKAVQYVKGTEKMLRRMKDELNKHKGRVEELESKLGAREGSPSQSGLQDLRSQLVELQQETERANSENEALNARIATLQNDFDRTLAQQQTENAHRVEALETAIHKLEEQLVNAKKEIEAANHRSTQMQRDLAGSPAGRVNGINGGSSDSDVRRLEQELATTSSKAAWATKEKEALEAKLNDANSKISLLLDAMERGGAGSSLSGHEATSSVDGYNEFWGDIPGRRDSASDAGSAMSEELRADVLAGFSNGKTAHGRDPLGIR